MTTAAPLHDAPPRSPGVLRRVSRWLFPRRRVQLGLLLTTPIGWLVVVYLGSLFLLLLSAFWAQRGINVVPFEWSFAAFEALFTQDVYRTVAIRTLVIAVLVTITDVLLAFPIAYYMARIASPRTRNLMVIAVLVPLWAAYLVKVYAWRTILQGNGLADWLLSPFGFAAPGLDELANSWLV